MSYSKHISDSGDINLENLDQDFDQNDLFEDSVQKKIERHFIKCISKMYWFFYRKPAYFLVLIPTFAHSFLQAFQQYPQMILLDAIKSPDATSQIVKASLFSFFIGTGLSLLSLGNAYLWGVVRDSIKAKIQRTYIKALMQQDIEYFDVTPIGEIINTLHNDVSTLTFAVSAQKIMHYQTVVTLFSVLAICFSISWKLTLLVIIISVLSFIFRDIFRDFTRNLMQINRKTSGISTCGVDLKHKYVQLNNTKIRLDIWDTAGQERFRGLAKNYFRGANGFILVYDISDKKSFDKLKGWMNDAKEKIEKEYRMIVVGNKKDCVDERQVEFDELEEFGKKNNVLFMEVSAKTGEGIDKMFMSMVEELLTLKKAGIIKDEESDMDKTYNSLDNSRVAENKHNCNC